MNKFQKALNYILNDSVLKPLFACVITTAMCVIMCFVFNGIAPMTYLSLVAGTGIAVLFGAGTIALFCALKEFLE